MAQQTEIAQLYYTLGARVDASTKSAVTESANAIDDIAEIAEKAGVPIGALQAAVEQLTAEVEGKLRAAVEELGLEMDEAGISAAVLAEQTEAVAEASAQSLGALSAQVRLYALGSQQAQTRQQSLAQLAALEQLLKGRLDQGNLSLEQRIRLQQVLSQTQAATSLATSKGITALASSQATTVRATAAVKALGDRWGFTAVNIVTAASSIVQSGNVSSGGLKAILTGATQLAGFLGGTGALVVAAGVAANAIIGVFTKAREEAKKATESVREEILRLQDAGDFEGLGRKLFEFDQGTAKNNYRDGMKPLREELARLQREVQGTFASIREDGTIADPFGAVSANTKKRVREIVAQLQDLKTYYDTASAALQGEFREPGVKRLPGQTITATSPKGDADAARKRREEAEATAEAFRQIEQAVQDLTGSVSQGDSALAAYDRKVREIEDAFGKLEGVTIDQIEAFGALQKKLRDGGDELARLEGVKAAEELEKITAALTPSLLDDMALSTRELVKQLDRLKAPPEVRAQLLDLKRTLDDITLSGQAFEERLAGIGDAGLPPLREMVALGELQREKEAELLGITEKGYAADQKRAAIKAQLAKIEALMAQLSGEQQVSGAKTVESASQLLLVLQETSSAAFGIATAFLGADATLTKMIGGTAQVAAGFSRISEVAAATEGGLSKLLSSGAGIASILPAVGGVIGGIGAILSIARGRGSQPDPVQQEQLRLYVENNRRLAELRVALDKQISITVGSAKAATVRDLAVTKPGEVTLEDGTTVIGEVTKSMNELFAELGKAGVSLDDFRAIAKSFGVELSESPTIGQLLQLQEFIRTLDFKKLTEGLEGQLDLLDLRKRIDPEAFKGLAGVGAQLDILAQRVPALRDALSGIDLSAADGPAAAMERLRALFEAFTNGEIDLSQLGEIKDPGAFAALIAQLIEAIRDAVPEAKSASDRFAAALEAYAVAVELGTLTVEEQLAKAKALFTELFPDLAAGIDTSSLEAFRASIASIIDGFAADGELSEAEQAQIAVLRQLLAAFGESSDAAASLAEQQRQAALAARALVFTLADAFLAANDITDPAEILRVRAAALAEAFPALGEQMAAFDLTTQAGRDALEAWIREMIASPDALAAMAEALGITVEQLVQQLLGLESAADSAAAKVASLADQLAAAFDQVQFGLDLEGITDPLERLRRTVDGIAGLLPDLDAALAGLDLSTDVGRKEAEARLVALGRTTTDAAVRNAILALLRQIRGIQSDAGDGTGAAPGVGGGGARPQNVDARISAFATATTGQVDAMLTALTRIQENTKAVADYFLRGVGAGAVRAPVLPQFPQLVSATSAAGGGTVVNVYATINVGAGVSPETARVAFDEGGARIRRQVEDIVETGGARRLLRAQRARGIPLQT